MAIFSITSLISPDSLFIRGNCISCVRQTAVEGSPAAMMGIWSNPNMSAVAMVRKPELIGIPEQGKRGIVTLPDIKVQSAEITESRDD